MKYTVQEFIEIWNNSKCVDEAGEKMGFTNGTVRTKASQFRGLGFDLKKMPPSGGRPRIEHARKPRSL